MDLNSKKHSSLDTPRKEAGKILGKREVAILHIYECYLLQHSFDATNHIHLMC